MPREKNSAKGSREAASVRLNVAYPIYPTSKSEHQPRHDNSIPWKVDFSKFLQINVTLGRKKIHYTNESQSNL